MKGFCGNILCSGVGYHTFFTKKTENTGEIPPYFSIVFIGDKWYYVINIQMSVLYGQKARERRERFEVYRDFGGWNG